MRDLLKIHFGYDEFRPLQEDVIKTVLGRRDALVLMPTGGGKSLCYQLPALQFSGITLVVSPLIALMKDQVDALQANGIAAACLTSTLAPEELRVRERQIAAGEIKIVYLAPERLAMPGFRQFVRTLPVDFIAVDEAHCISEWGHDFRPEYRKLQGLRADFPRSPVVALTATATKQVREDIVRELRLKEPRIFVSSFNRPNLTYRVEPKDKTFDRLARILDQYRGESALVYCFSRRDTETLSRDLTAAGFSALPYHAGLDPKTRGETQEKFIRDEIPLVVATIAFGMGIDKPNVRLVVHYHLPKSIEGYYQETGRAGRDGLPSECVLFYSPADCEKHRYFIAEIGDPAERARSERKLAEMVRFAELTACRRAVLLRYFGETDAANSCGACDRCLTPRETFDGTLATQKILSAVIRTGEHYGASYITDVLRGSRSADISARGHDRLGVFGLFSDTSKPELRDYMAQLTAAGYLGKEAGRYPTLFVTAAGKRWLRDRGTVSLTRPCEPDEPAAGRHSDLPYEVELFASLRDLRKHCAQKENVPPFVIFGDRTLIEMAYYLPDSLSGLRAITGVGEAKLERYGQIFLREITAYAQARALGARERPRRHRPETVRATSTYLATRDLVARQLPLSAIASARELAPETIVGHLEKLLASGEALDIEYLKPPPERFAAIEAAFRRSGQPWLTPVRRLLPEEYSYLELRLARLWLRDILDSE